MTWLHAKKAQTTINPIPLQIVNIPQGIAFIHISNTTIRKVEDEVIGPRLTRCLYIHIK